MAVPDDGSVVGRALAITDAVAVAGVATLGQVARSTGLPKATVHRVAHDLVARGVLTLDDAGYALGPRLGSLGARRTGGRWPASDVMPVVQELHDRSRSMTFLLDVDGWQLVTVGVAMDRAQAAEVRRRGGWPAQTRLTADDLFTAAGRVLLAGSPDVVEGLLRTGLRVRTPHSSRSAVALWRQLARVRDEGAAVERDEHSEGWCCVAAGVTGPDGELAGIVGMCGRSGSVPVDRTRWVVDAAVELSRPARPAPGRGYSSSQA
ncbi:IclR family transcriptional regulator [Isoptericola jiangsuensis]|uniref:IclR family transcriptional regulator n=1 Tax=Isoptericola jiangsuensis TaxID=548579 RepID=A0A2A9EV82_9MICO|nr:IclR family transcriptional regulator C-terminal domain-containing protein [Isoptericola jiangsuensis]PFG42944.1 IclR family transcriptional regulator [Isoptericola jiangsuensis]